MLIAVDIQKKLSSIRSSAVCTKLAVCPKYTGALKLRLTGLIGQQEEICDGAIDSIIRETTERNCFGCASNIKNM
jgi:hypothetical protein